MKKRTLFITGAAVFAVFILCGIFAKRLYTRKPMDFVFDGAYNVPLVKYQSSNWYYEEVPAGHKTYLYLPEKYRTDKNNEDAKLPLIVVFHGSTETGASLHKYGSIFIDKEFQKEIYPEGAAVLVILSRIEYFTDPHSTSLLIQNICIKNKCIDHTNIIGYGFSQGAKFVVELACTEPRLFRAVISGSGFYQMSKKELLSLLPVQFCFALSENDKGIFEQGLHTAKMCSKWCKNSRYKQYEKRWHFWIMLNDGTGKVKKDGSEESVMEWLKGVVRER